jgi:ornithine cyclodeaminase
MLDDGSVLYLSADDVSLACEEVDVVDAVRSVLVLHTQGSVELADEAYLSWPVPGGGRARSIAMSSMIDGELPVVGTKIINANPGNPDRGLPRASGLVVVFDLVTARPVCIMEGARISSLRTAAVSAVCVERLAAPGASTLGLLGAGVLARQHALLLARKIPGLTTVRMFDIVPGRSEELATALKMELADRGTELCVADSARTAVAKADVVVACTTTTTGYVHRGWLGDGAVVVNVSLDDLCEDALLGADRLYVDDWDLIVSDRHRLLGRLARSGAVLPPGAAASNGAPVVTGTIGQLLLGRCEGRSSPGEVCVVNPFGLAMEDIAVAQRVYSVARQRGLGMAVPR